MSTELDYHESRLADGTRLVTLGGELDALTAGAEIEELLEQCADGACHVVLDMSQVTFIDSSGLAVLLKSERKLCGAGRRLVILRPHPNVRRILEITGVDRRLPVRDSWAADGADLGEQVDEA